MSLPRKHKDAEQSKRLDRPPNPFITNLRTMPLPEKHKAVKRSTVKRSTRPSIPPRPSSPPGYTGQIYHLPLPDPTRFRRLSCCLLQYLQAPNIADPPETFFDNCPFKKTIYSTAISRYWSHTVNDFGLLKCHTITGIDIVFTAQKQYTNSPELGYHPTYLLEVSATCRNPGGGIVREDDEELMVKICYSVTVLGNNEARWDSIDFGQVLNCLRRTGKCKYNRFGEPRVEEEVLRMAASIKSPIVGTNVTISPPS